MAESKQSTYAKNKFEMNINDFIFPHPIRLLKRLPTAYHHKLPCLLVKLPSPSPQPIGCLQQGTVRPLQLKQGLRSDLVSFFSQMFSSDSSRDLVKNIT